MGASRYALSMREYGLFPAFEAERGPVALHLDQDSREDRAERTAAVFGLTMPQESTMNRRRFLQGATGLVAAASLEPLVGAQTPPAPPIRTARTNVLEIGYHESGDAAGFPVILLHGFPDDAHAYDGVAPILASARLPRARRLSARIRPDAVPRSVSAANGRTGGDRPGRDRPGRRAEAAAVRGGRVRLGRPRGGASPRRCIPTACARRCSSAATRFRTRSTRRAFRRPRSRPPALVSVVLQHRERARGPRAEPPRALRADVARVVADVALQRRRCTT